VRVSYDSPTTIAVRLRPQGGTCRVSFDVSPIRRGVGDPRRLGVIASGFEYVPANG
jgi:hypothetical protein